MGPAPSDNSSRSLAAPMSALPMSNTSPRLSIRKSTCRETAAAVRRGHRAVECKKSAAPRSPGCDKFHASRRSADRRAERRCAAGQQPVLAAADNPTPTPVRAPVLWRKAAASGRYMSTWYLPGYAHALKRVRRDCLVPSISTRRQISWLSQATGGSPFSRFAANECE